MRSFWAEPRGQSEILELKKSFPSLIFEELPDRSALVSGPLPINDIHFSLIMNLPSTYPRKAPTIQCVKSEIPWIADRHVFNSGAACLCTRIETRKHWPYGATLAEFVRSLVVPFFTCQYYFDAYQRWPEEHGRSHDALGILESARDFFAPLGNLDIVQIVHVLRLLARKGPLKGHESCPCGSNRKLRNCHAEELYKIREFVDPNDAQEDLDSIVLAIRKLIQSRKFNPPTDHQQIK